MKSILIVLIVLHFSIAFPIIAVATTELSNSGGGNWNYLRDIYIKENSGTTLTDYQVLIEMEGTDFPAEAQNNGEDMRFTDASGNELNHWIESWDHGSKNAKVWVKVSEIPAYGDPKIKLYYGNPNARSSSNGVATFEFFEDFELNNLDKHKWKVEWGKNFRISEGKLIVGSDTGIRTNNAFLQPNIFEAKVWTTDKAFFWAKGEESDNMQVGFDNFNPFNLRTHRTRITSRELMFFSNIDIDNSELIHTIKWKSDRVIFQHSYFTVATHSDGIPTVPLYLSFQKGQSSQDMSVDWARVRKYASPEPIVISKLFISKSASPYKIMQFKNSTISIFIKSYTDTDIKDINLTDPIPPRFDIITGDFPNPKKIDVLRPGESRQIQYSITAKETGNFTLEPARVTFTDRDGNIQERKSDNVSIIVRTPKAIAETPDDQPVQNASVSLHGEKTDVILGEDILLKLSAINLITKPMMYVQVILIPPSGMSVTSSEFSMVAAGQFAANYELQPGYGRDIEVGIRSNQVGEFNVNGRIVYYFGDDMEKAEDQTLILPIKVRSEESQTTPAESAEIPAKAPGFGGEIAIIGLLFIALCIRKRF